MPLESQASCSTISPERTNRDLQGAVLQLDGEALSNATTNANVSRVIHREPNREVDGAHERGPG
jgi:hypothetical protein